MNELEATKAAAIQQKNEREARRSGAMQRVYAAQIGDTVSDEDMAPVLRGSTWRGEPLSIGTPLITARPEGRKPGEASLVFHRIEEGWKRVQ